MDPVLINGFIRKNGNGWITYRGMAVSHNLFLRHYLCTFSSKSNDKMHGNIKKHLNQKSL